MKKSIGKQMAVLFIGLMTAVLAASLLIIHVFLEKYYLHHQQNILISAYRQLDEHISGEEIDRAFFSGSFLQMCNSSNMNVVVVDENYHVILGNSSLIAARIWGYAVKQDLGDAEVLRRDANYTIQKQTDPAVNMGYLEMWGNLPSSQNSHFMLRIPLTSIAESAKISGRFIMYVDVAAILIGALLIAWLSRSIARPIRELTDLSKRMTKLDFDARYTGGGENEIGQLGEHFNQMSEKLEQTISALKSANARLQKDIEQKTRIDQMRREFLANVSHELKTPIALISGYAEGLKEGIQEAPESQEYYCDVIIDEAGKMDTLVRKLLTLNQLEFGEDPLDMQRFDMAALIAGKLQTVRMMAQQNAVTLTYEGPEALHVWGDEFKIEEVLTNYLSNAFHHVDGERRIALKLERDGAKARVSVDNTGKPIPPEDLEKIWGKFYKVDKARTREYGGSGIGLSIVQAIMEAHQQPYGVRNTESGVSFWFELDLAESEA